MAYKTRRMKKARSYKKGKGLFTRVYSPLNHLLQATRNIGKSVIRRSGRIVNEGLGVVSNAGRTVVSHADATVRNVVRRKSRKNNKSRRANRK